MEASYFPCQRAQWVDVEGLIGTPEGRPAWQPGQLRAWSYRDGSWVGHVHYTPGPGRVYTAMLPSERIRGAQPPRRPGTENHQRSAPRGRHAAQDPWSRA